MKLICDYCGKEYKKALSQIKNYNAHFCSAKCYHKSMRKTNEIFYENGYAFFIIVRKEKTYKCLFDIEDIDKINQYKWHIHIRNKQDARADVCTNTHGSEKERKYICLARYLMNAPAELQIDHINRNPLDNRKSNLRICTNFENQQNKGNNTSGIVGVGWDNARKNWYARIEIDKKRYNLGRFATKEEAINARKIKEQELFPIPQVTI